MSILKSPRKTTDLKDSTHEVFAVYAASRVSGDRALARDKATLVGMGVNMGYSLPDDMVSGGKYYISTSYCTPDRNWYFPFKAKLSVEELITRSLYMMAYVTRGLPKYPEDILARIGTSSAKIVKMMSALTMSGTDPFGPNDMNDVYFTSAKTVDGYAPNVIRYPRLREDLMPLHCRDELASLTENCKQSAEAFYEEYRRAEEVLESQVLKG